MKELGYVDITPFLDFMNKHVNFQVNNNRNREKYFKNTTKCFFLLEDGHAEDINKLEEFMSLSTELKILFKKSYGTGYSKNIQYSLLEPKSTIEKHTDQGELFESSRRIHIPLITNKNVNFHIQDKKYNFSEGCVVEINNLKEHQVENNGEEDRVHLIIDYIPKYVPKLMR
jgi:aspartyl/asparaginyl beta-hydroxylase (cupin superfamily)